MKKIFILVIGGLILASCQKVHQDPTDVLFNLTLLSDNITADGTNTVTVTVQLNKDADATKRNVKFSAYPVGSWAGGDSTISVKAIFENDQLIARAVYKVSNTVGDVTIQAKPDLPDVVNNNYLVRTTLHTKRSDVAAVKLEPSSFGINSNYLSEVTLTGTLKNATGQPAQSGTTVKFEDLLADGSPAGGSFRLLSATTGATSTVSAVYSVGAYPIGTKVTIKVTVLDANGVKTGVFDSLQLTINK